MGTITEQEPSVDESSVDKIIDLSSKSDRLRTSEFIGSFFDQKSKSS